jgi:WhiB family redox-sensing transcriptional regulator
MLCDWEYQDLRWQQEAACLGMYDKLGEDLFFPPDNPGGPKAGKGVTGEHGRIKEARALCMMCPVRQKCLDYAIKNECTGVWGGTTDSERRRMARKRDDTM